MGRSATKPARAFNDSQLLQIAQTATWLSVREVAERLRISRPTAQRLVADGAFITARIGQKYLVEKLSIDAYIASQITAVHSDNPRSIQPTKQRETTRQRIYEHLTQAA